MLRNPSAAPEWMAPWYLADVRPAREAHLVEVPAHDVTAVLRHVIKGQDVTVISTPMASVLPPQVCVVQLEGVQPVDFVATFRREDRREPLLALVTAMRTVGRRLYGAHVGGPAGAAARTCCAGTHRRTREVRRGSLARL